MSIKHREKMIAALFSGGKDSTLAIHKMADKEKNTELLITMISENEFSFMFHKPNIMHTKLQAESLGIKQIFAETKGEKEKELDDLEKVLIDNKVTELITGAVASTYQKERIEAICRRLSIIPHSPLWRIDPMEELNELSFKYDVIITQVAAEGLDESYLGAKMDGTLIERLLDVQKKHRINLLFEGGEAESFVLDAPMFEKRIEITKSHIESKGTVSRLVIDAAMLVER